MCFIFELGISRQLIKYYYTGIYSKEENKLIHTSVITSYH
jgi:hypothetical protein